MLHVLVLGTGTTSAAINKTCTPTLSGYFAVFNSSGRFYLF